jgi:hypothetical protein
VKNIIYGRAANHRQARMLPTQSSSGISKKLPGREVPICSTHRRSQISREMVKKAKAKKANRWVAIGESSVAMSEVTGLGDR